MKKNEIQPGNKGHQKMRWHEMSKSAQEKTRKHRFFMVAEKQKNARTIQGHKWRPPSAARPPLMLVLSVAVAVEVGFDSVVDIGERKANKKAEPRRSSKF